MRPLFASSSYFWREPRGISTRTSTLGGRLPLPNLALSRIFCRRDDELLARIGRPRRSGIGDERHVPAPIHLADELRGLAAVVELGVARQVLRPDVVLTKEDLGVARVLTRDHVRLLKDAKTTQRDVLKIADRRRYEIKLPHPQRPGVAVAGEYAVLTSRRSSISPTRSPCWAFVRRLISFHSSSARKARHAASFVATSGHSRR